MNLGIRFQSPVIMPWWGRGMTTTGASNPAPPISLSVAALTGASRPSSQPAMQQQVIISDILYPSPVIMPWWGQCMTTTGAAPPAPPIFLNAAAIPGASRPSSQPAMRTSLICSEILYPSPVIMPWWGRILTTTGLAPPARPIFINVMGLLGE